MEDLDRDSSLVPDVPGAVDHGHAATQDERLAVRPASIRYRSARAEASRSTSSGMFLGSEGGRLLPAGAIVPSALC